MPERRFHRCFVPLAALAVAALTSCAQVSTAAEGVADEPATLEAVGDTGLHRLTLTEQASARLDLQTAPVREEVVDGQLRLVVPHSALIYDAAGAAWAYASTAELTFVREPLTVERVAGDLAVLVSGPPVGTEVVTVGAAELYGAEHDVGH